MVEKKCVLTINFDDKKLREKFINWKRLILGRYGYGGIKKRFIEVIERDLKEGEKDGVK